jgi:hypothetical protein
LIISYGLFRPDKTRVAHLFDLLTIVVFVLKPYKIAFQTQEGWQSLVYCNGLEIPLSTYHNLSNPIL